MPKDTVAEIIEKATTDPETYRAMAAKEADVWSKNLTNPQTLRVLQEDKKAAGQLKLGRHRTALSRLLAKHQLKPARGLSLGCGAGRAERQLLGAGVCSRFHGIDIAPDAVASAEQIAAEMGLAITYEVQDINFVTLPPESYDLIIAQTSLHHVLRLEHVADEISKCLASGGLLWIHDYIGESQLQYSDKRLEIINDLLKLLPAKLRFNHLKRTVHKAVSRKDPGTLVSPFESIRSGEIREIFLARFDVVECIENDAFMAQVVLKGTRANYLQDENTRAIFEVLLYVDRLLIEHGILPPMSGQYLLKKRSS